MAAELLAVNHVAGLMRYLDIRVRMDVSQFTSEHGPTDSDEQFQLENKYLLEVAVDGSVITKAGSMVAFTGDLSFTGSASAEGGITGFLKEAATGEGTPVMTVEGHGDVYLADQQKKIQVLHLGADDAITVNGEDVLAFENRVEYEISTIDSLAGSFAGGFTNVYLEGRYCRHHHARRPGRARTAGVDGPECDSCVERRVTRREDEHEPLRYGRPRVRRALPDELRRRRRVRRRPAARGTVARALTAWRSSSSITEPSTAPATRAASTCPSASSSPSSRRRMSRPQSPPPQSLTPTRSTRSRRRISGPRPMEENGERRGSGSAGSHNSNMYRAFLLGVLP